MIRAIDPPPPEIIEVEGTPEERERALADEEQFRKNADWYSAHVRDIRDRHSGKFVCVAGQELFVGDDAHEVRARAKAAHPDAGGFFSHRISKHRGPKIYANKWSMGP